MSRKGKTLSLGTFLGNAANTTGDNYDRFMDDNAPEPTPEDIPVMSQQDSSDSSNTAATKLWHRRVDYSKASTFRTDPAKEIGTMVVPTEEQPPYLMYVGGLPCDANKETISALFLETLLQMIAEGAEGEGGATPPVLPSAVAGCHVVNHTEKGFSIAFVEFSTRQQLCDALLANGKLYKGKHLHLALATHRQKQDYCGRERGGSDHRRGTFGNSPKPTNVPQFGSATPPPPQRGFTGGFGSSQQPSSTAAVGNSRFTFDSDKAPGRSMFGTVSPAAEPASTNTSQPSSVAVSPEKQNPTATSTSSTRSFDFRNAPTTAPQQQPPSVKKEAWKPRNNQASTNTLTSWREQSAVTPPPSLASGSSWHQPSHSASLLNETTASNPTSDSNKGKSVAENTQKIENPSSSSSSSKPVVEKIAIPHSPASAGAEVGSSEASTSSGLLSKPKTPMIGDRWADEDVDTPQ